METERFYSFESYGATAFLFASMMRFLVSIDHVATQRALRSPQASTALRRRHSRRQVSTFFQPATPTNTALPWPQWALSIHTGSWSGPVGSIVPLRPLRSVLIPVDCLFSGPDPCLVRPPADIHLDSDLPRPR